MIAREAHPPRSARESTERAPTKTTSSESQLGDTNTHSGDERVLSDKKTNAPSLSSSCLTSLPHLARDYRWDSEHRRPEVAFHTPGRLAWRPPIQMSAAVSLAHFSALGVLRSLPSRRCETPKFAGVFFFSLTLSLESDHLVSRYSAVHALLPTPSRYSSPRVWTSLWFLCCVKVYPSVQTTSRG